MGRLSGRGVDGRLGRQPARLAIPITEAERSKQRAAIMPGRALYNTKRWKQLRLEVLRRDGFTCQQTGVRLTGKAPAPNSPVVDHIRPHRGDAALFFDPANLQSVSKAWHDSEKQRQEKADWLSDGL
jgi:5-methylcytosine-specific restriction endonuclease McrA